MLLILIALLSQDLSLTSATDWESAARPWMTRAESTLYDQLDARDRQLFRGVFIARRLENPNRWPATGPFAPGFFPPKIHGDIRDLIRFAFKGQEPEIQPHHANPKLPRSWRFDTARFDFLPKPGGGVRLAPSGQDAWEQVVRARIINPEIRYDFHTAGFGRTRFPEDLQWRKTELLDVRFRPHAKGVTANFMLDIPLDFGKDLQATINPNQNLELLILLKQRPDEDIWQMEAANRIRHASVRVNLATARVARFEAQLPPGNYQAALFIYSGFLPSGLRADTNLTVLPTELPRIGTPVVAQRTAKAGIVAPQPHLILAGDSIYQPLPGTPNLDHEAVVLIPQYDGKIQVTLQPEGGSLQTLKQLASDQNWTLFKLPAQTKNYRLLATGEGDSPLIALSSRGAFKTGNPLETPPALAGVNGYLEQETLSFRAETPAPTHLFVNDMALIGSKNGSFPWPGMDWGETAELRFEIVDDRNISFTRYQAKRGGVFENIQVRPKYLVTAVKTNDGFPVEDNFKITHNNQPVDIVGETPLRNMSQLWGIVVNDTLLKAPSWPKIREEVFAWIKGHTREHDQIYVVHNAHRPRLILPPTTIKPAARAALFALAPTTRNENYFNVRYLVDALTHLKQHQTRPHQVLLLTNQLTSEVQQMEDLLTVFRQTGLQLYNLEFPFSHTPEIQDKIDTNEDNPLVTMAVREQEYQRDRLGVRDDFLERSNVTAGWSVKLGSKRNKRRQLDDEIRATAYRSGFNERLAYLTAGLAASNGDGETVQGLQRFFSNLTTWQRLLVHLDLSETHPDEDLLRVIPSDNQNNAAWTLVEWNP